MEGRRGSLGATARGIRTEWLMPGGRTWWVAVLPGKGGFPHLGRVAGTVGGFPGLPLPLQAGGHSRAAPHPRNGAAF